MLQISVSTQSFEKQSVDCYGLLLTKKNKNDSHLKKLESSLGAPIVNALKIHDFSAKFLQTVIVPVVEKSKIIHVIVVGLGEDDKLSLEKYRKAVAHLYRQANAHKVTTIALDLPAHKLFDISLEELAQQTATTLDMTAYSFDSFMSKENKKKSSVTKVIFTVSSANKAKAESGAKKGMIVGKAVNTARQWVNTPPSDLTPPDLAKHAKAIASKYKLKFTQFSEKDIIKKGMGGLAGVSRGSDQDCQLAILEYKTSKKNADTIAFVGKGITFDSGGLSLKPPAYMETMKEDMSGAAAVIATMEAIAQLKPGVNVVGITPLSENLPSGKATKPGDVLKFYNGKTAEVKNTDAEGRLVLADALAYATKHYKPDAIIDIATLTGACAHALGPFHTGLMSQNDDLVEIIEESAEHSGDHVWRLPLTDEYAAAIKSDVADMCNIGSQKYMAGATTAAHFLKHFVGDTPWAHLDIAGTAFNVPDKPYYQTGATGVGVRLLVDIAQHWK